MKSFFSKKIVIAILFFLIGLATGWSLHGPQSHSQKTSSREFSEPRSFSINSLFDDDFFSPNQDPFEEMRRLQKQMKNSLGDSQQLGQLSEHEDDESIIYELSLPQDQTPQKLQVDVKNGQVIISASIESKKDQDGLQSSISSSFHRSFPAPTGVDAEHFKLEQSENKIILKFPKKKNS